MGPTPEALAKGFQTYGFATYMLALALVAVVGLFWLLIRAKDRQIERVETENARLQAMLDKSMRDQLALAVSTGPVNQGLVALFEYLKTDALTGRKRRSGDTGSHPVLPSLSERKPG